MRWLRVLTNAALAAALFGVIGNIAAGTVAVADRWKPWVWAGTVLLGCATVGLQIRHERLAENKRRTPDRKG